MTAQKSFKLNSAVLNEYILTHSTHGADTFTDYLKDVELGAEIVDYIVLVNPVQSITGGSSSFSLMGTASANSLIMPTMDNFVIYKMFKTNPPLKQEKEIDFNYTPPPTILTSVLPMPKTVEGIKVFEKVLDKMDSGMDLEDINSIVGSPVQNQEFWEPSANHATTTASEILEKSFDLARKGIFQMVADEASSLLANNGEDFLMNEVPAEVMLANYQAASNAAEDSLHATSFKIQTRKEQYLQKFLSLYSDALSDLGADLPPTVLKAISPNDLRSIANSLTLSADLVELGSESKKVSTVLAQAKRRKDVKEAVDANEDVTELKQKLKNAKVEDKKEVRKELKQVSKEATTEALKKLFFDSLTSKKKFVPMPNAVKKDLLNIREKEPDTYEKIVAKYLSLDPKKNSAIIKSFKHGFTMNKIELPVKEEVKSQD